MKAGSKIAIIVAIISALGIVIAALLPVLLNRKSEADNRPPTREDLVILEGIRDILITNQALNIQYSNFKSKQTDQTTFLETFSTLQLLSREKQDLQNRLERIKVTPRYSRLFQILHESLTSDKELFGLEDQLLRHTLTALKTMEMPPAASYDSLGEEERRNRVLEDFAKMHAQLKEWLKTSDLLSSQEKAARVNSIQSINLLNEELQRLHLPYVHENSFDPKADAPKKEPH